ncbi:MAG: toll/interleukin-1 receptor domain-containing protein [Magnetococcales bacterium]|nr:toll/interleukin-1 receptor domain-containing protein [Nitrospirota bacterium]
MGYDVFISYDRKDQSFADKLVSNLEGRGISCWIDRRDLSSGSKWANEISKTIKENPKLLMVVLLSASTLQSEAVEDEIAVAVRRKVHIIPVLLENIELTGLFELHLTKKTWIKAFDIGIDNTVEKICDAVRKLKDLPPEPKKRTSAAYTFMRQVRITPLVAILSGAFFFMIAMYNKINTERLITPTISTPAPTPKPTSTNPPTPSPSPVPTPQQKETLEKGKKKTITTEKHLTETEQLFEIKKGSSNNYDITIVDRAGTRVIVINQKVSEQQYELIQSSHEEDSIIILHNRHQK